MRAKVPIRAPAKAPPSGPATVTGVRRSWGARAHRRAAPGEAGKPGLAGVARPLLVFPGWQRSSQLRTSSAGYSAAGLTAEVCFL